MPVPVRCSECERQTGEPFTFPDDGNPLCVFCAVERVQIVLDHESYLAAARGAEVERLRAALNTAQGEAYLGALIGDDTPDPLTACRNVIEVCLNALHPDRANAS